MFFRVTRGTRVLQRMRRILRCNMRCSIIAPVLLAGWLLGGAPLAAAADEDLPLNARLLVAARNADGPAMTRALAEGAAINSRNRLGETALVVVLKNDRVDLARALIDAGADVNLGAINGVTPLMAAAYGGHVEIVRVLLAKGADISATDRLKKNAMTYAAGEGKTAVVALFLEKGVDPNAVYQNDLTALMWAAGYGRTETVNLLLGAGANSALKDDRGKTAQDMARENQHNATAEALAASGAERRQAATPK